MAIQQKQKAQKQQTQQNYAHDNAHYDILVIGGGLIGASFACAMAEQNLRIGVIEAVPFKSAAQPSYDDRSIALSLGSKRIFDTINIWLEIKKVATPINKIHVSDRGHFGVTRLDCFEQGVEALGYVVMSRDMGFALGEYFSKCDNIDLLCPASVVDIKLPIQGRDSELAQVTVKTEDSTNTLSARLVVAADGRDSAVRQLLNIKVTDWDYKQSAIVANITSQHAHQNVAYERFTSNGPIALLPLSEGRSSLVWTRSNLDVDATMAMDDNTFIDEFQQLFGYRLGKLEKAGSRHAYPLRLVHAREQVRPRLALIGNAAHSLHPIAGQGFNLGLRDVATLVEIIQDARHANNDIGQIEELKRYAAWRKRDHLRVVAFTDGLVRLFSTDFLPFAVARNIGLVASDILPPFKKLISRQAMGLTGKLPRIARGLNI